MQAMAQQFGGQVSGSDKREFHARIQAESSSSFIETLLKVSEGYDVDEPWR